MSRTRLRIEGRTVPRLARGVRFQFDKVRERWVLLAPERLFVPDETAVEVLKLVDGTASVDAIADALAARYAAPRAEIACDVAAMIQELADKGSIEA